MTFYCNSIEAPLLALSNELLQSILSYLELNDLLNIDLTCKRFSGITGPVYHIVYGPNTFLHCKAPNPLSWKRLLLEEEYLKNEHNSIIEGFTPDKVTQELLSECYYYDNAELAEISKLLIIILRSCTERWTPSWLEAMATAMMAQGRFDDAKLVYQRYLRNNELLPEKTLLTATHFGWPTTFPSLPDSISQTIKEAAIFGAAAGCNQEMVTRLYVEGVSLDHREGSQTLARLAAAIGNLPLLKYLHGKNIDILEVENEPLKLATRAGQVEVVNFLLGLGGRSDIAHYGSTPLEIAVLKGNIQLLRIFFKHTPDLVSAKTARGKPVIMAAVNSTPTNTTETLEYLIQEARMDMYAIDDMGNTLAHEAALYGDLEIIKVLHDFKMNLLVKNIFGHTPQDLASAAGHAHLAIWLSRYNGVVYQPEMTRENAVNVIASRHSQRIEQLASDPTNTFPGNTAEEKAASIEAAWNADGIEDKLVSVYLRYFSPDTLQLWSDILGGEVDQLMLKLSRIFSEALRASAKPADLRHDEELQLQIACLIADKLVPFKSMKPRLQTAIVRNMALADLQTLNHFFNEELGRKIAAGEMARVDETAQIFAYFCIRAR